MPTITVKLNKKEMDAIKEYASQCGESIPDLVRKSLIRDATLADGYGAGDHGYDFSMKVPQKMSARSESKATEKNYNKIRRIMGWKEIRL
jgi:hypothetical protein